MLDELIDVAESNGLNIEYHNRENSHYISLSLIDTDAEIWCSRNINLKIVCDEAQRAIYEIVNKHGVKAKKLQQYKEYVKARNEEIAGEFGRFGAKGEGKTLDRGWR